MARRTHDKPVDDAAALLRRLWTHHDINPAPHTAVILGSGLGAAGDAAERHGAMSVSYSDIPGMPSPRVDGHSGRILAGGSRLKNCVLLQGRVHYYEGYSLGEITTSVRILKQLGVRTLVITNAAGGIRSSFRPGDLMLINDHLTMLDLRPLSTRSSRDSFSSQDLPMSALEESPTVRSCWDAELREQAIGIRTSLTVHSGVYAMMPGPNYETPAEVRMLRTLGADAVGMSTIPEALQARWLGMRVIGVSCITNVAAGLSDRPLDHKDVGDTATSVEAEFTSWLWSLLTKTAIDRPSMEKS